MTTINFDLPNFFGDRNPCDGGSLHHLPYHLLHHWLCESVGRLGLSSGSHVCACTVGVSIIYMTCTIWSSYFLCIILFDEVEEFDRSLKMKWLQSYKCVRSHQNDAHVGPYMFLIWWSWNNLRNAGMPLQFCTFQYGVPVYKSIPFKWIQFHLLLRTFLAHGTYITRGGGAVLK